MARRPRPERMGPTLRSRAQALGARPWKGPLWSEPMLAFGRAAAFDGEGWIFEPKLDGFRLFASRGGDAVRLRYRSSHDATAVFPELVTALRALPADGVLLDGELVVIDGEGRPSFEALQSRAFARRTDGPRARFFAFDLLAVEGLDLRPLPLGERRALLATLLEGSAIDLVQQVEARGTDLFEKARALGLEGIVAKRQDSRYEPGRSASWIKVKVRQAGRFVAVGLSAPSPDTFGMHSLHLAERREDALAYVGRVGLPRAEATALLEVLPQLARRSPPCTGAGRVRTWLEPAIHCEVRFMTRTGSGKLREPLFLRFLSPDQGAQTSRNG